MTAIVNVPATPTVPVFPALGSASFNAEAYAWGTAMPTVASGIHGIAESAKTNATAAKEQAEAAQEQAEAAQQIKDDANYEVGLLAAAASTSAGIASGYASAASSSAGLADGSKVAAGVSAGLAEGSRIAASKLNLGGKASAPALDNQGDALLTGATYYDTVLDKWRVWTGIAWADGVSSIAGVSSLNGLTGDVTLNQFDVGDTLTTARALTAPDWLYCDGGVYLQSSYADLYAELGLLLTPGAYKLPDPATLPTGFCTGCSWDSSGTYLAVSHITTPFITVYSRSGTTLTKLPDPATLPTGTGYGCSWDSSGTYLAVAYDTTPFITVYDNYALDTATQFRVPNAQAPAGTTTYIKGT